MYAGLGLWAIGQPLLVHNSIAGVLVIPAWGALCLIRIPREETLMGDRFGSAWDTYAARTGRLLPKLQER